MIQRSVSATPPKVPSLLPRDTRKRLPPPRRDYHESLIQSLSISRKPRGDRRDRNVLPRFFIEISVPKIRITKFISVDIFTRQITHNNRVRDRLCIIRWGNGCYRGGSRVPQYELAANSIISVPLRFVVINEARVVFCHGWGTRSSNTRLSLSAAPSPTVHFPPFPLLVTGIFVRLVLSRCEAFDDHAAATDVPER